MTNRFPFWRCLLACGVLFLVMAQGRLAAADLDSAYAAWSQGRPEEAVMVLREAAPASGDWQVWHDYGLAAAAAGQRAEAITALLMAHRLQPDRWEPIGALRSVQAGLPATWLERLGLLALPGSGWWGVLLALVAGAAIGGLIWTRWRWPGLAGGIVLVVILAPGLALPYLSDADRWQVLQREAHLLDSTGTPVRGGNLPAATLVERAPREPWADRVLVTVIATGQRGWLPQDVVAP